MISTLKFQKKFSLEVNDGDTKLSNNEKEKLNNIRSIREKIFTDLNSFNTHNKTNFGYLFSILNGNAENILLQIEASFTIVCITIDYHWIIDEFVKQGLIQKLISISKQKKNELLIDHSIQIFSNIARINTKYRDYVSSEVVRYLVSIAKEWKEITVLQRVVFCFQILVKGTDPPKQVSEIQKIVVQLIKLSEDSTILSSCCWIMCYITSWKFEKHTYELFQNSFFFQ